MKKNPNFIKMERVEKVVAVLRAAISANPSFTNHRMVMKNILRYSYDGLTVDITVMLENKSTEMWVEVDVTNDVFILEPASVQPIINTINQEQFGVEFGLSTVLYDVARERIDYYDRENMDTIVSIVVNLLNKTISPWLNYPYPVLKARK